MIIGTLKMMFVGLVLSAAAAPALAAPPADTTPADQSAVMAKIDPDRDGTVTLAEAKTAALAEFKQLDTDKEGTLDAGGEVARRNNA